jgi:hypothetical protein
VDLRLYFSQRPEYFPQVKQYIKHHIAGRPVVDHHAFRNLIHQVSPHETKFSPGIMLHQSLHQVGGVKIARGFAGYKKILHDALMQI